jgi:glycerol-3-phosphate dehydrogenase (NAD(P)+)
MGSNQNSIGVIGGGKWGYALFEAFKTAGYTPKIWSRTRRDVEGFCELAEVLACKNIVVSIATQSLSSWLSSSFVFNGQKILVASKGIDSQSGKFLNEIYADFVPPANICYLSGPSFAAEVRQKLPTALVITSEDKACAESFVHFFPPYMKIYLSDDVKGIEIAGAYKNVIAIAGGISEGLGLGNNAKAALITRGLAEMSRFGLFFGAKIETFMGLSGVGDLFLTATSELSRNFRVGLMLARGMSIDEILTQLNETAEGVETAKAIVKISQLNGLYTPIADEIAQIIEGKEPKQSLARLLVSSKREEF